MVKKKKSTLVIAGASGFVGRWFIEKYRHRYHIVALSRKEVAHNPAPEVEWRQVDLYSISNTVEALAQADFALYLVHSMSASTRLNQGTFDNTDLLLADNFARAAEMQKLKHIVFIGGILPEGEKHLSRHLRSRKEVEQTLAARATPLTSLRAGIIIGPGGSSFTLVRKLVENLPVMACPRWCESLSQPISVHEVLPQIDRVLGQKAYYHQAYELGGRDTLSYTQMLRLTARHMGKRRLIFTIPISWVGFSKLWVARFTGSSTTFVSPLVESLRHTMILNPRLSLPHTDHKRLTISEAIADALSGELPQNPVPRFKPAPKQANTVRSFQRLPNPRAISARRVALLYERWLPRLFRGFIHAHTNASVITLRIRGFSTPILVLKSVAERSDDERWLFYITDGWLVKRKDYGWLEFRKVLEGQYFIAAIHEFVPRLPWYFYLISQAPVHRWVMLRFESYLQQWRED